MATNEAVKHFPTKEEYLERELQELKQRLNETEWDLAYARGKLEVYEKIFGNSTEES